MLKNCNPYYYHQMKKLFYLSFILCIAACSVQHEKEAGWIQLFNGKDLTDWRVKITGYTVDENFNNTFGVEDGILKVRYNGYTNFDNAFGHLFYHQKYSHYLLSIEYRFVGEQAEGGPAWAFRNSGAMVHSQDPETMLTDQDFPISIEVQFLGGNGKDERPTANLCTPGTNVVINGELFTDHCIPSGSKTYHGDQWVSIDVLVLGDSVIQHKVNGETVLAYEKPQIGGGVVSNYDTAVKKDGMLLREGYIALQSESHPIDFRKVALFNLEKYTGDDQKLKRILEELTVRKDSL
jgi:hypothetical protein